MWYLYCCHCEYEYDFYNLLYIVGDVYISVYRFVNLFILANWLLFTQVSTKIMAADFDSNSVTTENG